MKRTALFIVTSYVLLSSSVFGQEQFTKKISVSFDHLPLREVLAELAKTQGDKMGLSFSGPTPPSIDITLHLDSVTLDQVMDSVLAQQTFYKDYRVTSYGEYADLQLFQQKMSSRFFDRNKNKGSFYHVGDKLPDSAYAIDNYPVRKIKLADLKKKLIILDLWNINCSGCIQAMPEMEHLQNTFRDSIQIILVTKDSPEQVEMLKRYARIVRETTLPLINGEDVLGSLFDYVGVPRQIWIDEAGRVVYSTNKEIATEKYIRDFLAGKRLGLHETKDTTLDDDYVNDPLSTSYRFIHQGDFAISSFLAPHNESRYRYISSIEPWPGELDTTTVKIMRSMPADIRRLYKLAFKKRVNFPDLRVLTEYKAPGKYDPDLITDKNLYDYQLLTKTKEISAPRFYRMMQEELDAFFNISSSLQQRNLPCYVLKRKGNTDKLRTAEKTPGHGYTGIKGDTLKVYDTKWENIISALSWIRKNKIPIIDETGIDPAMRVDCSIDVNMEKDLQAVIRSLAPYGLTILREERPVECIVLKDALHQD